MKDERAWMFSTALERRFSAVIEDSSHRAAKFRIGEKAIFTHSCSRFKTLESVGRRAALKL
jgi:hypothetical protein